MSTPVRILATVVAVVDVTLLATVVGRTLGLLVAARIAVSTLRGGRATAQPGYHCGGPVRTSELRHAPLKPSTTLLQHLGVIICLRAAHDNHQAGRWPSGRVDPANRSASAASHVRSGQGRCGAPGRAQSCRSGAARGVTMVERYALSCRAVDASQARCRVDTSPSLRRC